MGVFKSLCNGAKKILEHEVAKQIVVDPLANLVVDSSKEIVTTVGSYIVQSFIGSFQKSIEFEAEAFYGNEMEQAFYNIMARWNNMERKSKFCFRSKNTKDYMLADGYHNMKYRRWNVVLIIETVLNKNDIRRTKYTVIGYDFSNQFIKQFHKDLIDEVNKLRNISPCSRMLRTMTILGAVDYGVDTFEREIYKRPEDTVFLPESIKNKIKKTLNKFIQNKQFYIDNGIPYSLNILLYGPPGTGKDTIVKMIASMYNLTITYITEADYQKVPKVFDEINKHDYITEFTRNGLIVLSDVDKYPALINEANIDVDSDEDKNFLTKQKNSSLFGKMINILDGYGSDGGRIIVMTTNHIEKFSKAFIRPGRIHLLLEIPYVTKEVFIEFYQRYFKEPLPEQFELKSDTLTIAEMQNDILLEYTAEEFIEKYICIK